MSMWTAASDIDYDYETGNGDRWDDIDVADFDAWCEATGILDWPADDAWEEYLRARWEQNTPRNTPADSSDDVPF